MKDIMTILHTLFVLALYAASVTCLVMSLISKDTYILAMAILLYIIAVKHESEVEDGNI